MARLVCVAANPPAQGNDSCEVLSLWPARTLLDLGRPTSFLSLAGFRGSFETPSPNEQPAPPEESAYWSILALSCSLLILCCQRTRSFPRGGDPSSDPWQGHDEDICPGEGGGQLLEADDKQA